MKLRTHLIRVQKSLFQNFSKASKTYSHSTVIQNYSFAYKKNFRNYRKTISRAELIKKLETASVILCGDYHCLSQAQKTVLVLLQDLLTQLEHQREIVLCLEMLCKEDGIHTRNFLKKEISEKEFLEKISYQKKWGFSWNNYKRLFELAQKNNLEVIGLNTKKKVTIAMRDKIASKEIVKKALEAHHPLVFSILGDFHLCYKNLPRVLRDIFHQKKIKKELIVLHQNPDWIYWELEKKGKEEQTDVVEIQKGIYALMTVPPWIKLQSYLSWQAQQDFQGIETDYDDFYHIIKVLQEFFGIVGKFGEDIHLFFLHSKKERETEEIIQEVFSGREFAKERNLVKDLVKKEKAYYSQRKKIVFFPIRKINHFSSQAGVYLHTKINPFYPLSFSIEQDFYFWIWREAIGFLSSKVINPRRKCLGPYDLELKLHVHVSTPVAAQGEQTEDFLIFRLCLAHLREEIKARKKNSPVFSQKKWVTQNLVQSSISSHRALFYFYQASCLLGQILGNALFSALGKGFVSRNEVRSFFGQPTNPIQAKKLYFYWTEKLDSQGYRNFSHSHRF